MKRQIFEFEYNEEELNKEKLDVDIIYNMLFGDIKFIRNKLLSLNIKEVTDDYEKQIKTNNDEIIIKTDIGKSTTIEINGMTINLALSGEYKITSNNVISIE